MFDKLINGDFERYFSLIFGLEVVFYVIKDAGSDIKILKHFNLLGLSFVGVEVGRVG